MRLPTASASRRHFGDATESARHKFDEINLRQRACRTTGSPPRREVERSWPTFQSEPVSSARLSTRPTHCDAQLARSTPPRAHRGNVVRLPPPKLAPRVVSHPVQLAPSGPTPKSRSGPGEEILGKNPQLMFETHSEFFIPQIGAQLSHPPVLIQPDGGDFG